MVYPQSWPFTRETDQFHHVGFGGTSCSDTPCCCEMMWSIHQRLVWQCLIFFSTTGCTMRMELLLILIPSGKHT